MKQFFRLDRALFSGLQVVVVAGVGCLLLTATVLAEEPVDYNRDIRPLLSDRCFYCHGPDEAHREADLRLDVESAAKEFAITAGMPDESEIIARIFSQDDDLRMPPADSGKSLNKNERELIRRWVKEGAVYDAAWAYVPPRRRTPPETRNRNWSSEWIDQFILARLDEEKLQPSPPADRITLIRRLSFDLTGLPPTPDEVESFVNETDPAAYERLVDRLLSSKHFGERMAIYWLDLVRYADTVGYHGDQDHRISPYRDYVIEAFNNNLPFDQFTREQLAGDLLPGSTLRQKIATGYNRMLQTTHEGGLQPKEYLAIYGADRVRNFSVVWMGATMGCCECHDHKYDPFTIRDFYSMQAFFADIDEAKHFKVGGNKLPTNRPPEIEVLSDSEEEQLSDLMAMISDLETHPTEDGDATTKIEKLQAEVQKIHDESRKTMVTVAIEPRTIRVLPRGNWLDDSGDVVTPAIPAFLGKLDVGDRRANRLDLANWLTDVEHGTGGLTARVMVNRFWYLLFGVGLSKSLDDFGGQGEPPVHPELLDTLAVEFYESGWDIKHLLKLIVMSQSYQQSSVVSPDLRSRDPENRLYAHQTAFRLPAEMIRDNALAVSGLLVEELLGESVKPYQPAGYYRHLNFPVRRYHEDHNSKQWRRGVYMHWQRQYLHPMLKAFDAPSREECTAMRSRSNTPAAALVLLNDPTFIEAARAFATRLLTSDATSDAERLELGCHLALSRPADEFEQKILLKLLTESRQQYRQSPEAAKKLLEIGDSEVGRNLDASEVAAWMQVTRALLNTNESITRN